MRAIVVLMDSLNRRFLEVYGNTWVKTPNITRLAGQSVVFDNHWVGSAPCMPARRDMLTGRLNFPWRPWGPLEPYDRVFTRELKKQKGTLSHMVTDHWHYFEVGGNGYVTSFDSWEFFRGQEDDPWVSEVKPSVTVPPHLGKPHVQYIQNQQRFLVESDMPGSKTFQAASDWIDRNKDADDFLLWVEAFDPHEPFDCPPEYLRMYNDDYTGRLFWSSYQPVPDSVEAVTHLQRRYAGLLSMVDHWFGKMLDTLEKHDLLSDTLVILTSDHGHLLGEHGLIGKGYMPFYNELAHIPLIVHFPGNAHAGERVSALTQNVDIAPTLLEYFGCKPLDDIHGGSWLQLVSSGEVSIRRSAIYGTFGQALNVTDGEFTYFRAPLRPNNAPLSIYTTELSTLRTYWGEEVAEYVEIGRFLPFTRMPVYKAPANKVWEQSGHLTGRLYPDNLKSVLYNIRQDYQQQRPIEDPSLIERMAKMLAAEMSAINVPEDQFERLGLQRCGG